MILQANFRFILCGGFTISFFLINITIFFRMVHIAIACCRVDLFSDDGFKYLKSIGYSTDRLDTMPKYLF